jgi:hypothetical protein
MLTSSEGKPASQSNYDDTSILFVDEAGGAAMGETSGWKFCCEEYLGYFQTSEAESSPNLVSQRRGGGLERN